MTNLENLEKLVLNNDYCIGCGICAGLSPTNIKMTIDQYGFIKAKVLSFENSNNSIDIMKVCPFSGESLNENEISDKVFDNSLDQNNFLGHYHAIFAGRVRNKKLYSKASSGGLAKWLLMELLDKSLVDYVIQVCDSDSEDRSLFRYKIISSSNEVINGSKSAYYPVELSSFIKYIRKNDGRYAVVGLPCFIKALRLASFEDPLISQRLKFTLGIFCGHLKSTYYAEMISWQLGIKPNNLKSIDFRVKYQDKKANEKGIRVTPIFPINHSIDSSKPVTSHDLFGTDYGQGFFKYNACDYCDDVVAETADISFGDAWLPKFMQLGTSLVITRNKALTRILENGLDNQKLFLEPMKPEDAIASQDAGFRHRRTGIAYRLFLLKKNNLWFPKKRVAPTSKITTFYKIVTILRIGIKKISPKLFKIAKKNNSWNLFKIPMLFIVLIYKIVYKFKYFF